MSPAGAIILRSLAPLLAERRRWVAGMNGLEAVVYECVAVVVVVVAWNLFLGWLRDGSELFRRIEETAFNWLGRHPLIAAFLVAGFIYAITRSELDLIGSLAVIAFFEMSILWAEVTRLREKLDDLEKRGN